MSNKSWSGGESSTPTEGCEWNRDSPGTRRQLGQGRWGQRQLLTWAGITSDAPGFGDAVQGRGRMWVKTTLGR